MRANRERGEHGTENASSCSGPNGEVRHELCGEDLNVTFHMTTGAILPLDLLKHIEVHLEKEQVGNVMVVPVPPGGAL